MGKAGRPKGSPNKRSQMLLLKLEKEHKFSIVSKIVDLYNEIDSMGKPLIELALANAREGLVPTTGMTPEQVEMINGVHKNKWAILGKLLSYCYPKLKALEVAAQDQDNITFNINIPKEQVKVIEIPEEG